jgi:predicted PurR-regulated permease PerM
VAVSLFLNAKWQAEDDPHAVKDSMYSLVSQELAIRFRTFYRSFAIVIGAQIVISAINTGVTAVFLIWNGFPYVTVIIVLTFICGLLPIIGNILSNVLIVGVGFTISPKLAFISLIFLVVIHKLEYFLNSKIVGSRIKNPMWLTLLGIVLGEKLMGIPGMILAPVVLHYIKVEASRNKVSEVREESPVVIND